MNHKSSFGRCCLAIVLTVAALGVMPTPLARAQTSVEPAQPAVEPAQPAVEPAEPVAEPAQPAEAAGEMKTMAVVGFASYNELLSDTAFLGSLGGQAEVSQMVEGGIALFTQGKGLASIDRTMPWGVILQTDGAQFVPIACLPVTKLDDLLQVAMNYGVKVQPGGDDGVTQITMPSGQSLFVKAEGGWAFIAQLPASLDRLPLDPQATLSKLVSDYDVAVMLSVQNIPEMYRQIALQAIQAGMEQGLERQEGSDDEQHKLQQQLAEAQKQQIVMLIEELDSLTLGWAVDATQQNTYVDVIYSFLPESTLAKQVNANSKPTTNFAGFYQPDAALTMMVANKSDPELLEENIEQLRAMMSGLREQINQAIDESEELSDDETRQAIKDALADLLDAAQATAENGQADGGVFLQLSPESMTVVAGALIEQPEKVEQALKKVAAAAEDDPEFPGIEWNVVSHAGVNFHTLRVPVPADEKQLRTLVGEEMEVAVGIGPQAVYFALGRDWQTTINAAIDASVAEPNKAVPPFEMSVSLGKIMKTAAVLSDEEDLPQARMMADMLENEAQGHDHIRLTGKMIPNGLRYRVEAEEGVLRAIGEAAAKARQEAMQQQQQQQPPQ